MNKSSFPCFLKSLFIFDTNLQNLVNDEDSKEYLKSKEISEKIFILPENFEEALYSKIQQTTAILEYKGHLEYPIFELGDILLDSLKLKLIK